MCPGLLVNLVTYDREYQGEFGLNKENLALNKDTRFPIVHITQLLIDISGVCIVSLGFIELPEAQISA